MKKQNRANQKLMHSTQGVPQSLRTTGQDLTELAVSIYGPSTYCEYLYDYSQTTKLIGWHLFLKDNEIFLGSNSVVALLALNSVAVQNLPLPKGN